MEAVGKRAQNKRMMRENLIVKARELFTAKGFEFTTVADIVEACNIGRGTFYNYFDDVKEIFDAVVNDINARMLEHMERNKKEVKGIYNILYTSFINYFEFVSQIDLKKFHEKNLSYIRSTTYGSDAVQSLIRQLQQDLKNEDATCDFREDYEIELLSYIMVGAPAELFLNSLIIKNEVSNKQMASFLAKLISNSYRK